MNDLTVLVESQQAERGFYPTPAHVAEKMLEGIDFSLIKSILEPSAGKGDLCDAIVNTKNYQYYTRYREDKEIIDCIEIDPNLQSILKGKEYRVVHNDFLTYQTQMPYDLIIMNPPFADGDKHLMKALSMVKKTGGQVVCLLNAQTIENPYSNIRKELIKELEQADECQVEKVSNAFSDAERPTDVEICIVKVKYKKVNPASKILEEMKKAMPIREPERDATGNIIKGDWRDAIVDHYNYEIACGLRLIDEHEGMEEMLKNSIGKDQYAQPMLKLTMGDRNSDPDRKEFVKRVRLKYWKALFYLPEFTQQLTSNILEKFRSMVHDLKEYEFSPYNIVCVQLEMSKQVNQGVSDTIMQLFDDWTRKYHYSEGSNNVWYYNGWKTNDCFAVNEKVILPMYQCINTGWDGKDFRIGYGTEEKLNDIEKVFDYLNADTTEPRYCAGRIVARHIEGNDTARNIPCKYFMVSLFKKGTCHIRFTNMEVLKKFNLFAARGKNWLPPSYGRKTYKEMDAEEKAVIDSFEGEAEYAKVLANADYYLMDNTSEMLRIGGAG